MAPLGFTTNTPLCTTKCVWSVQAFGGLLCRQKYFICVIFSVNSLKRFLLWLYECVDLHFQRHSPSFHQASWSIYNCSNSLRYEILIHMKISGSGTLQPQPGSIDWCCNWRLDMISFVAAFVSGFCRSELIAVSASQIAPVSQTMLAGLWFLFHWISTHWCPQVWISN